MRELRTRRTLVLVLGMLFLLSTLAAEGQKACPGTAFTGNATTACSRSKLLGFSVTREGQPEREVVIWRIGESSAFFYESSMYIDADGAPNAYHPSNSGLDDLANAGEPGRWWGLAKDENGNPYVQGPEDPYPGFYVSATALTDRTKRPADPRRYVDASKIPYVVLPRQVVWQTGARLGDFAVVFNLRNGRNSAAIFADIGPSDAIGEGSIALADRLGIRSNPRRGGAPGGIFYIVFPDSGNGRPRTLEEIDAESSKLLQSWGGMQQLASCVRPGAAEPAK